MGRDLGSLDWTFRLECPVPNDIQDLLVDGEYGICAYQTIRDVAVFTNRRLIVKDVQGLMGKKVEIYSIPYSSIIMYSSENAGNFDFNAEIELWTRAGNIKIKVDPKANIRKLDKIIATAVLNRELK
jgi:hypothetical protein|nr:MAG TPA: Bacterial PH domain protein [Caudoviricetes sp.]